ncbi:Pr6Pr family membrane protein [Zhouia spongiae]|uniref:Pr6Pr family membrane protein n=1 Tax=Zhouia spongiae TaxID=2202721 RepID=A0ABY3YR89_9FLAO|nr:Pr6Pr family membrane protein [Zhouia spongiae]UNZ00166.1 Pr6Pr family membrane protein [Zhouia spongiae]
MKGVSETIGFILGWFAIIAQFIIMIQTRQTDLPETIIRFFSFFTILTNLLLALFFTTRLTGFKSTPFHLFWKKGTLTALTVFILIVGLVYQFVLRDLWHPRGLQYFVDELLHTVIPLWTLIYWGRHITEKELQLKSVLSWLVYPVAYLAFILIRGHFSKFYPYPFLNIPEIGYENSFIKISIIFGVAILIMIALILIGKFITNNKSF